jgi:hypothetical protein
MKSTAEAGFCTGYTALMHTQSEPYPQMQAQSRVQRVFACGKKMWNGFWRKKWENMLFCV